MPQNTSRTSTPGRGARSRYARRRPAEAGRRLAHIDSWTGVRSRRYVRSATAARLRRRSRTTTHGRVPGHGTLGRSWPKPETTSRTSTLGRCPVAVRSADAGRSQRRRRAHRQLDGCPVRRDTIGPQRPRSWRTSRSATSRTGVRSRYARPTLAEARDDVAHIDFRTGARSSSHDLPAPAETGEDATYTDCRTGAPVPAHPAHDQRTNSARPGRALQRDVRASTAEAASACSLNRCAAPHDQHVIRPQSKR
jgi:hypothetical protein